jgi:hypothetical protein
MLHIISGEEGVKDRADGINTKILHTEKVLLKIPYNTQK